MIPVLLPFSKRFWTPALLLVGLIWILTACAPTSTPQSAVTPTVSGSAEATPAATAIPNANAGAPVVVAGKTIFRVRERVGSFTPTDRAQALARRINELATNPFRGSVTVTVVDGDGATDIVAGDEVLYTVTDNDAAANGEPRLQLAQSRADAIQQALNEEQANYSIQSLITGIVQAIIVTAVFIGLLIVTNRIYRRVRANLLAGKSRLEEVGPLEKSYIYRSGQLHRFLLGLIRILRIVVWLVLAAIYLVLVFSFFPETRGFVQQLAELVLDPLATIWDSFVAFIPNLFFILIIALIAWGLIRLAKVFFVKIQKETIKVASFDPEWAMFTFNLVAFLDFCCRGDRGVPIPARFRDAGVSGNHNFLGAIDFALVQLCDFEYHRRRDFDLYRRLPFG